MLRMGNTTILGIRTLYTATVDGLKMEKKNERIKNLAGIIIMLVVITVDLVIPLFYL